MRQLLEASVILDWVLKDKPEHWARMYYVASLRESLLQVRRAIPGTRGFQLVDDALQTIGGAEKVTARARNEGKADEREAEIERLLSSADWKETNAIFERAANQPKGKQRGLGEINWYELGGVRSVREMATAVGRRSEYATPCFVGPAPARGRAPKRLAVGERARRTTPRPRPPFEFNV